MKRCPTCNQTFTERNLSFCIDDGTPLVPMETFDDEVTVVSHSPGSDPSNAPAPPRPAYQPPGGYAPPGTPPNHPKRKVWPWILGILALLLLLLIGIGIAAAIFVPKMLRESANTRNSNVNTNVNRDERINSNRNESNSNTNESNSNTNESTNANSGPEESSPAPTDEQQVLTELTDLEHEWTVANINADKKALNRILADDYVGKNAAGETEGKADYLKTIKRDTSIQKWEFEDLKVDLKGDRAALSGIVRLQVDDKPRVFTFTDKFVWRDGRWQAIGSDVKPLEE